MVFAILVLVNTHKIIMLIRIIENGSYFFTHTIKTYFLDIYYWMNGLSSYEIKKCFKILQHTARTRVMC